MRIMLIRHAEKPEDKADVGLSYRGRIRAAALAALFDPAWNGGAFPSIGAIYAAADSKASRRPAETVEPTAAALRLVPTVAFADRDVVAAAAAILRDGAATILVCWHHEQLPRLATQLGVAAAPEWPGDGVFDRIWTIDVSASATTLTDVPQRLLYGDSKA